MTSHVISDLKAFTSYSVTVASVDQEGNVGPRSTAIEMLTGEAGMEMLIIYICHHQFL